MKNFFIRRIFSYFLNGLLLALPIYVTVYVLYTVFNTLDGILPIEHKFPGLGIIILLVLLIGLGYLGAKVINEQIKNRFMKFLDRIPFIKTIYKSITDMLGAFVGNKKRFNKPVLVQLSKETDVEVVGFITDEDLQEVGNPEGKIGVYLPMSYSFSGHLVIVPKANVKLLDTNSLDLMKYVVSGGVVEIEVEKKNEQK
ncbi:MAG: DUF502 domain-containing protein [Bacteroidota bacterium]|jgi:uncharacterized membrane protein